MSNMNYNKMYESDKEQKVEEVNPTIMQKPEVATEPEKPAEPVVAEVVTPAAVEPEKPKAPEARKAVVCNCTKLNVRKNPYSNADILAIINADEEVEVRNADAKGKFYPVRTASGIEGFCMKDYLKMK